MGSNMSDRKRRDKLLSSPLEFFKSFGLVVGWRECRLWRSEVAGFVETPFRFF